MRIDFAHPIRDSYCWRDADGNMDMIAHHIDRQKSAVELFRLAGNRGLDNRFVDREDDQLAAFGRPDNVIITFPEGHQVCLCGRQMLKAIWL